VVSPTPDECSVEKGSMRKHKRSVEGGFTLIELMMVVVLVGVLSVLAIYSGRKYVAYARSTEARNAIGQLAKDAVTAYEKDSMNQATLARGTSSNKARNLCASATASVPAAIASVTGHKYQSTAADWATDQAAKAGFSCLKFTIDEPQYYMYSYSAQSSTGGANIDSFTASAQGDPDGNGVTSLFQVSGLLDSTNRLTISPNIIEVRPDE
jgi:type IV pilus assembly protein PilA